jgi:predicted MPP superfamily phosphohydrolase
VSDAPTRGRTARSRFARLALPVTVFTVVYFAFLIYPPLRLADLLWPAWRPGTPALLVLIVAPILGRVAYEVRPGAASRFLASLSLTWLGLAFLLFCALVPFEPLLVLGLPERGTGLAVVGLWALVATTAVVGAHRLAVTDVDLRVPGLDRPLTLVQLSDVHLGSRSAGFLDRVVRRVEALQPDGVLITGDLVDFRDVPAGDLAPLARLEVPTWFCIGNHERYVDCEAICERLASHGVRVLRDAVDATTLPPLVVAGVDDAERRSRVREGLEVLGPLPEGFRILLYHRPDGLEDAATAGVDLMLAGHTHNGQIVPFDRIVRRFFPRIRGLYRQGPTRLWVSSGTGTWGPVLRLGSSNEITRIRLLPDV